MKHQWLIGGRAQSDRWVVITKDNLLLWFGQVCPPQDIVPEKSNGWVKINQTKFEPHPEIKNAFLLTPEKSPAVIFTCPDSNTYEGWYGYLKSISEGGDGKIEEKRLVFGRDLEQLLQSEDINIPKLVVKCAEFIRNNGTDVKGIFRLSGQADEIQTYTKAFDRGEDVIFTIEADVNAVAGVLKSFFRAMPEPAIPSSLYQLFLSVSDIPSAIAALKELPKANYDLMNYLCHFLFEMAQYVEVTSMNFENISIVFAPNLLRSTDPNCLSGLTDTPKVLRSIQFLVENYQHIWTEGPPVVSEKGRVHAIHSETSDFLPMHKESVPVRIPKSNTFSYQNAPPKVSSFHSPSLPPSDIPPPLRSPSPSYSVPLPHAPSLPPSDLPPPLLPPSSPTSSSPPMATPLPSIPPPALSPSPPLGNSPPNQNNIPNTGPPTTNPPPPDNPPATNPPTDSPLSSDIPVQSTSPPPSQSLRSNSETSLLSTFLSDPAAIPPLPSSPSNPSSLRSNSTLSSSSPFNRPESELTSPRSSNSSNNLWSSNQGIVPREVSKPKLFKGSRTLGSNRATMQIKSPLNFDMDPKKPNAALPEEE
uniref:Rho-GAP domain-containing protein n=1 Tax=Arcella intermedia TaxID=1963864 RepID=A0A6B2L0N4_9EUKA